ncbi:unnamed protein product [Parnassius mnemosyne]|uniref:RNase H type-1 domain-containing protein n=1 Tax=Parnassius mnemosyne TaxID=213953 RepID=A0AAV1LGZ8_9NEOP
MSLFTSPLFNTPFKAIIYQPNIHLRKGFPEADLKLKEAIGKNWKDWMTMYTDASKNTDDGCTGAAVWIPRCHLKGISVCLAWIPSHSGICENDKADLCAKEATRNDTPLNVTYSHDLLSLARKKLVNTWNEIWKASQILKGKHYAAIQDNIPSRPLFFIFNKANKRATSIVCRLRIGHVCTYVHLAKLRIRDSSLCECGLDEGNTIHIFFNCTKLSSSLYDYLPPDIPRPIDLNSLLIFTNTSFVYILCDFINSNNIKL